MPILSKVVAGLSALSCVTGVACLSGWGSRLLGPQTVEDMLSWEGRVILNTDTSIGYDKFADRNWWIEKLKLAKGDQDGSGYLYNLASKENDQNPSDSRLYEFKSECYKLLKTGYYHEDYLKNYGVAKKYCVI